MDLGLIGKRAIVTGGSKGIGFAIAGALAAEGTDVVIAARGVEALEKSAAEIAERSGRRILAVPVDTGDDTSVQNLVARAVAELGGAASSTSADSVRGRRIRSRRPFATSACRH